MKKILLIVLCSFCVACGFQLRGSTSIPFKSIYISALEGQPIVTELKRTIQNNGKTLVLDKSQDAEATLQITNAKITKHIWSISGSGRVREFQLRYQVSYRIIDIKGLEIAPTSVVTLTRIMPFADAQVLAKEGEERMLVSEMHRDAAWQIIQRLSKVQRQ